MKRRDLPPLQGTRDDALHALLDPERLVRTIAALQRDLDHTHSEPALIAFQLTTIALMQRLFDTATC